MESVLELLCSSAKLNRDRGAEQLNALINEKAEDRTFLNGLCGEIVKLLADGQIPWESKHGALTGSKSLLQNIKLPKEDDMYSSFQESVLQYCLVLLEDDESRVRLAAGEFR